MEVDGSLWYSKSHERNTFRKVTAMFPCGNYDLVTQDNPVVCYNVGTIFFLPWYTFKLCHPAKGSVHLFMTERLALKRLQ